MARTSAGASSVGSLSTLEGGGGGGGGGGEGRGAVGEPASLAAAAGLVKKHQYGGLARVVSLASTDLFSHLQQFKKVCVGVCMCVSLVRNTAGDQYNRFMGVAL